MLENIKITKVLGNTATGTSTINTAVVDMAGYAGVIFVASISSDAANNGMKLQQGQAANLSDAADLAGSELLCNGTGESLVSELQDPAERYVRASILRGTTTVIDAVYAIQFRARNLPQINHIENLQAALQLVAPPEGAA